MLRYFFVYFQWLTLTVGGSMQHGRDMEAPICPNSVLAPGERLEDLRARFYAVWCGSGLVPDNSTAELANFAAMRLAWLCCQPLAKEEAAGPGRPRKAAAALAAAITIDAFEAITKSRVDLPPSETNDKPRGLEPLLREIFAVGGIDGNAKAAIAAAPMVAGLSRVTRGSVETAGEYFERAKHLQYAEEHPEIAERHAELARRPDIFESIIIRPLK
jgi:hypothetical protein